MLPHQLSLAVAHPLGFRLCLLQAEPQCICIIKTPHDMITSVVSKYKTKCGMNAASRWKHKEQQLQMPEAAK